MEDFVRARIDPEIKRQAIVTLNTMGLSLSEAIRIYIAKIVKEQCIPFQINVSDSDD